MFFVSFLEDGKFHWQDFLRLKNKHVLEKENLCLICLIKNVIFGYCRMETLHLIIETKNIKRGEKNRLIFCL